MNWKQEKRWVCGFTDLKVRVNITIVRSTVGFFWCCEFMDLLRKSVDIFYTDGTALTLQAAKHSALTSAKAKVLEHTSEENELRRLACGL